MLFWKKKKKSIINKDGKDKIKKFSSNIGTNITSIDTAKAELYHPPKKYTPSDLICKKGYEFFGIYFDKKVNGYKPLYIPKNAINHKLFVGYTRSGKGIIIGNSILETLRNKQGLIYVDVKQEDFIPQIIKEELERQGRADDFKIINYPNDFGYSSFNTEDTIIELWEKISTALTLEKSTDEAVDYYRANQRMTLLKVLEVLYNPNNEKTKENKRDWYFFMEYVRCLFDDLQRYEKLQKELQKEKDGKNSNQHKIEELSNMYFSMELLENLKFNDKNIDALEMIYMKTFELLLNANIYTNHNIKEALYENKVLYFKCDMENMSSLQMLKTMYVDISQTVRREKSKGILANCHIVYDEISFYVDEKMSGGLSVLGGFGINCSLLLQDLGQIENEGIKNAILSNSTVKLFYKISDKSTLDYVTLLGGEELVSKYSKRNLEDSYSQELEPLLNTTRIRAMWFQQHAILIAEYFNTAIFIETDFVKVKNAFDWNKLNNAVTNQTERYKFKKKEIKVFMDVKEIKAEKEVDEKLNDILKNSNPEEEEDF